MGSNQYIEQQAGNFAKTVIHSAGWTTLAGYSQIVVSLFGNLFLARILLPSDFGVFALASSLLAMISMFAGFGSQEAIIQCRDSSISKLIPTAFWITVGIAGGLSIAGMFLAVILRSFYSDIITQLIASLALLRFFTNMAHVFSAILQRELRFKPIAFVSMLSTLASFLLAGLAAWLGAGYWALLLREAVAAFISLIGLWRASGYRIEYQIDRSAAHWIWGFGWRMMISRITEVIFGRFDNLVVGTLLGTVSLGHYALSYRLAFLVQQLTQGAFQSVVFAAFSSLQHSTQKLQYGFERLNYWLWRVVLPLGLSIALAGDKVVILLYGEKWQTAGHMFQLMFIFLSFLPFHESTRQFLTGAGYINVVVRTRLIQIILFVPMVTLAAWLGTLSTVVWVVNISVVLNWWLMTRAVKDVASINWSYLVRAPLLATCISAATSVIISTLLNSQISALALVIFQFGTILCVYSTILLVLERKSFLGEIEIIRTRFAH